MSHFQQEKITVCYITRGEHSIDYNEEVVAQKRKQISDEALDFLPKKPNIIRLNFVDGKIQGKYNELREMLLKIIKDNRFDCVFVTSKNEPTSDHYNLGKLLKDINDKQKDRSFDIFEYYVWAWDVPGRMRFIFEGSRATMCFKLSNPEKKCKQTLIDIYFRKEGDIVWSGAVPRDFLFFFSHSSYEFFTQISRNSSTIFSDT